MRPGPGLVVMALAFISGARRGSTSTSTSSKISATSYSTSSTATIVTPSSSKSTNIPDVQWSQFFLKSLNQKSTARRDSGTGDGKGDSGGIARGSGGGFGKKINFSKNRKAIELEETKFLGQHQQQRDIYNLPLFVLPSHRIDDQTEAPYRDRRSVSTSIQDKRRARTISLGYLSGEDKEKSTENRRIYSSSSLSSLSSAADSSLPVNSADELDTSELSTNSFGEGLPVHYPSHTADSSTSFEEDDIFGLVAEHDLISEESFDRLAKLTQKKISYVKEDDYSEAVRGVDNYSNTSERSSGRETGINIYGSESQSYSEHSERTDEGADSETRSFGSLDSQSLSEQEEKLQALQKQKEHSRQEEFLTQEQASEEYEIQNYYSANLIRNNQNIVSNSPTASLSWSLVEERNDKRNTVVSTEKDNLELPKRGIIESASPLTRLNPWISACDLAQPGIAPDLQVREKKINIYVSTYNVLSDHAKD